MTTWSTALEPTDEPAPTPWRAGTYVAALVVLLSVAGTRYVADLAGQLLELVGGGRGGGVVGLLGLAAGLVVALVAAGLVLLALRHPWPALVVALVPVLLVVPLGAALPTAVQVVLAGVSVAAAWRRPVAAVVATVAALGAILATAALGPTGPFTGYPGFVLTVTWHALAVVGLLAACLAARVQVLASQEHEQRLVERSTEVEEESAVTAERARLARDLHDVVAHHVSLIAVRAETAPYTHPGLGAEARAVLGEIASDARRALDELRGVLGILGRSTGDDRVPQPSWGDVAALVERAAASGERVRLEGDARAEVDPTVGYVAYRVVQEGLTNARKHAPGAAVTVRLERTSQLAVVSVSSTGTFGDLGDSGEPTAPLAVTRGTDPVRTGHGLVGMRERVESLGGRLVAQRRDGGFTVEATLPLLGVRA